MLFSLLQEDGDDSNAEEFIPMLSSEAHILVIHYYSGCTLCRSLHRHCTNDYTEEDIRGVGTEARLLHYDEASLGMRRGNDFEVPRYFGSSASICFIARCILSQRAPRYGILFSDILCYGDGDGGEWMMRFSFDEWNIIAMSGWCCRCLRPLCYEHQDVAWKFKKRVPEKIQDNRAKNIEISFPYRRKSNSSDTARKVTTCYRKETCNTQSWRSVINSFRWNSTYAHTVDCPHTSCASLSLGEYTKNLMITLENNVLNRNGWHRYFYASRMIFISKSK